MIFTVNYTKKNSFMKEPRLKSKNLEGDIISDTRYVKPTVPRSARMYVPPLSHKKNMFLVALNQTELNKIVEEIGFYDDDGGIIKEAPLNNPNAPFWKHPELKIMLYGSGTTLNDEVALDKFWLKVFESDPNFKFSGDNIAPSMASRVNYTVTKIHEDINGQSESNDEAYKAMKLLTANEDNHEKLTSIIRAMGANVRNPSPKLVRDALLRKITDYKDAYVQGTSERNIEMFIRLAETSTKDLKIKALIQKAKKRGVINKNSRNIYSYGDFKLGSSIAKVEDFLLDKENAEILNEILDKTKD